MTQALNTDDHVLDYSGQLLEYAVQSLQSSATLPTIEMSGLSNVGSSVQAFLRSVHLAGIALVEAANTGIHALVLIKNESSDLDGRIGMATGLQFAASNGIDAG